MLFDFEKFSSITARVFPGGPYSLEDALDVFKYYFEKYEARYRHCDYNINHFFSGKIRELRFYEELY